VDDGVDSEAGRYNVCVVGECEWIIRWRAHGEGSWKLTIADAFRRRCNEIGVPEDCVRRCVWRSSSSGIGVDRFMHRGICWELDELARGIIQFGVQEKFGKRLKISRSRRYYP